MNFRKLSALVALLPLFATQQSVANQVAHLDRISAQTATLEWQRYRVEGEEFSVLFPVVPAMTTTDISYAPDRSRRERTLAAYWDGVVYLVRTVEKKKISLGEWISRTGSGGQPETVMVDGVPGKSATSETDNTISHAKWLETPRSLYKFSTTSSKPGDHSADVSKFFSSISFSKKSEGRNVLDGPGEQPLTHPGGTPPDSVFRATELTVRARVLSKPEPSYTEHARQNQVTGTVVLRGILSSSGGVENITVLRKLPDGLTEKAIMAARKIRFIPAIKDGRFVSMWIQLEYNFNLY